jgi:hypothetical protein
MVNTEKHEAVMKTITARRRAMNPPMIIDDERRKMSKLGEEKGGSAELVAQLVWWAQLENPSHFRAYCARDEKNYCIWQP